MTRTGISLRLLVLLIVAAVLVLLVGCTQSTDLGSGSDSYVSGDGTVSEFAITERDEPLEFAGMTDTGEAVTSEQYRGHVLVVNFWYAACAPCRQEAPWLQALSQQFADEDVQFLGVNVRDSTATAQSFAATFGVTYPSVIDTDGSVTLAFSGLASPTAVPTTVVLDRQGRAASRIIGLIEQSTLESMIDAALAESVDGESG